jgi:hypothetical protein
MVMLAACGGGDDDTSSTTGAGQTTEAATGPSLVKFFGDDLLVPGIEQRATLGVADAEGVVSGDVPDSLDFTITSEGAAVGPPITVASHRQDLPRPYYPLVFTVTSPGVYTASAAIDGQPIEASFQVVPADSVFVPQVGDPMPNIPTPTVADGQGVNPICTRDPQCPLHDVSLSQALTEGRPVALPCRRRSSARWPSAGPCSTCCSASRLRSPTSGCSTPRSTRTRRRRTWRR